MRKIILPLVCILLSCEDKTTSKNVTVVNSSVEAHTTSLATEKKSSLSEIDSSSQVKRALQSKSGVCVSNHHCIKYVDMPGTKVKIIEILIQGTTSMQVKLYDKDGKATPLEPAFELEIKGTKVPATIDVNLIKK